MPSLPLQILNLSFNLRRKLIEMLSQKRYQVELSAQASRDLKGLGS
jgi:hypothetical protein